MHLSHRSARANEECRTTRAQLTTIACFAIGCRNVCTVISDEGDVIVMQATQVYLDKTIQWLGTNQVACAAACDKTRALAHTTCRGWIQDHNIVEANAVGQFRAQRFIISKSQAVALDDFCRGRGN